MNMPEKGSYRVVIAWGENIVRTSFEKEHKRICKYYENLQTIKASFPVKELD